MHVAVVFSGLAPEAGGGHTFEAMVLRALRRVAPESRHEFTFYSAGDPASAPAGVIPIPSNPLTRARRVAVQAVRDFQDRANAPRPAFRTFLERSVEERGVELVWFASHHVEDVGQPFVCTVWDMAHLTTPWFPEIGGPGEWERRHHYFDRMLPRAACVIVPNSALTPVISTAFHLARDRILELPFPTPEFALAPPPPERDEELLRAHRVRSPYLFYPAQFWPHKNHVAALRTLALLDDRRTPPFELVMVGSDKGELERVRGLARALGVEDRARFLGFVSTDELVALYRNAHCLLYPSFLGPANLPPLEALALGCPVVCADVPGMREQLGDAALFAPPTDAAALAACVQRLDDPAERARLLEAGGTLARGGTADAYVAKVLAWIDGFEPVRACW